ncbi:biotin/lipoyl-containing protein [Salibacterium aidingense]|uniref:biotin/lipoyl-containing protein n=1 Tax=Salibacterium aidingense TaxID=384933 RepID=UPI0004149155|nr:biotin/lipoyl-binding protein [Salibacterium aidingense]
MFQKVHEVTSLHNGTVTNVYVDSTAYVYEWEPLLSIENKNKETIVISFGASGIITQLNVKSGDQVSDNTIIAVIEDDMQLSGSD